MPCVSIEVRGPSRSTSVKVSSSDWHSVESVRKSPLILVIDDDPVTVLTVEQVLRDEGFDVVTAGMGRAGFDLLCTSHPDLVLADLRLPDISALDILRLCRRQGLQVPLVVVTGFGATETIVEAMRLGAADFVEKPLIGDELVPVVRKALEPPLSALVLPGEVERHALTRWARAVLSAVASQVDPRTIELWSRQVGISKGALKTWCLTAGFSPKRSLNLARILRGLIRQQDGYRLEDSLDIVDRRTLSGLLARAGVATGKAADLQGDIGLFLDRQTFVRDANAIEILKQGMRSRLPHL